MKIAQLGILSNPSTRDTSHNAGWTGVVTGMITSEFYPCTTEVIRDFDDLSNYDIVVVNEGVNYREGTYNLFGGVTDKVINKLKALNEFEGPIYSFGEGFDVKEFIDKRKIDLQGIDFTVEQIKYKSTEVVLGDSHSISVSKPGDLVLRNDGKTMFGALNEGLINMLPDHSIETLTIYFGNIDVRHHLARQISPELSITDMCIRLEKQIKEIYRAHPGIDINLVQLLPIENESRKLPKTGYYKGTPFYGSWDIRNTIKDKFNEILEYVAKKNDLGFLKWEFDQNDELPFDKMEARQSVHIAPKHYMFNAKTELF